MDVLFDTYRPANELSTTSFLGDTDRPVNQLSTTSFLGAALPPVPHKLVEKIESGAFVEMGELLPSHLILTDNELK